MKRILIKELIKHIGDKVKIKGWVQNIRDLGMVSFLIIRDRSGLVQVVHEGESLPEGLSRECVISIEGVVKKEDRAVGGIEIHLSKFSILSETVGEMLPFEISKVNDDINEDIIYKHRAFSLRNSVYHNVFKIQAEIISAYRDFLRSKDFTEIMTPKIVASGTEGGTDLFSLEYFDKKAFLAQSPQFYKQMMVGAGYERVFEIGKAYRAEKHDTSRHINEYVSLDFEMGFIDSYQDIMNMETELLKYIIKSLKKNCSKLFNLFKEKLPVIPEVIPQITLKEAQRILKDKYNKKSPANNLDPEGEVLLYRWAKEKYDSEWVFVIRYPAKKRPFYTMYDREKTEETLSFDLLFRGLEITTGGQRIHSYQLLTENMKKFGLVPENYQFYLDIFKYGMPPHGGLAIGLERLTMKLCGMDNIRQTSLFPRTRSRITP
ncbi:MAG: aspartate--tRNA(Asn) ligase [Halothermotrichaceae bacterium]